MSPTRARTAAPPAVITATSRMAVHLGETIREERGRRHWTLRQLGDRAGLSGAAVHAIEAGRPASLETYTRIGQALALRLEAGFASRLTRVATFPRQEDPVHAAMGELEARLLRARGFELALDEPYQHFQFAGRADVVAWSRASSALIHIENKTQLPNVQDAVGSYAAKRAYLGPVLAARLGVGRWRSETHLLVALWSAEVLHVLRLRHVTFDSICPDPPDAFAAWLAGYPPAAGHRSTLILLDPAASGQQRTWVGRDHLVLIRPRHHNYAAALAALHAIGSA
ncbi:MAG: helix-turn-helix transcriptional regulator [Candidatus Limnocylindrales bacterium]